MKYDRRALECNEGWAKLYEPLIEELEKSDGFIAQIKEKFGGLRFYYDAPESWTDDQRKDFKAKVYLAEGLSFKVCEFCGEPGTPRRGGWIKTLCDKCSEAFYTKERQ